MQLRKAWLGVMLGVGALTVLSIIPVAATASAAPAKTAAPAKKTPPAPVVTGIVKHKGKPVYHAKVVLFAEPRPSTYRKIKKFHDVPMKVIGSAYTNRKGDYSVTVTGKALRQAEAYSFGKTHVVNLQVAAFYGPKTDRNSAAYWFTRLALGSGLKASVSPDDATAPATGAAADAPQVVNLNLVTPTLPKNMAEFMEPDGIPPTNPNYCNQQIAEGPDYVPVTSTNGAPVPIPPVEVTVGATYSNMADVTMGFTYQAGQDSSLGVGISVGAPAGTPVDDYPGFGMFFATAGYQLSESSTATIPFTNTSGYSNTKYQTAFVYYLYLEPCSGFTAQPTVFAGGSQEVQVATPSENNAFCKHYGPTPPGQPFTLNDENAQTFSDGVGVNALIGINLSAQTGYDYSAAATYALPDGGTMCGTNGYAVDPNPGIVYAGEYNHSKAKPRAKRE
jgi:hypothetical protein